MSLLHSLEFLRKSRIQGRQSLLVRICRDVLIVHKACSCRDEYGSLSRASERKSCLCSLKLSAVMGDTYSCDELHLSFQSFLIACCGTKHDITALYLNSMLLMRRNK